MDVSLPVSGPGDAELSEAWQSGVGEGGVEAAALCTAPSWAVRQTRRTHKGFRWRSCTERGGGGGLGPDGLHLLLRALSMSAEMAGVRVTSRGPGRGC